MLSGLSSLGRHRRLGPGRRWRRARWRLSHRRVREVRFRAKRGAGLCPCAGPSPVRCRRRCTLSRGAGLACPAGGESEGGIAAPGGGRTRFATRCPKSPIVSVGARRDGERRGIPTTGEELDTARRGGVRRAVRQYEIEQRERVRVSGETLLKFTKVSRSRATLAYLAMLALHDDDVPSSGAAQGPLWTFRRRLAGLDGCAGDCRAL